MKLIDRELEAGKAYSLLPCHKKNLHQATASIVDLIARTKGRCYLSLSWGKQSIILAHMLYHINPHIPCVHWSGPDANIIADFSSVKNRFLSRWPIKYVEFDHGDDDLLGNGQRYLVDHDLQGYVIGFAADESRARKMTLAKNDDHQIATVRSALRCTPLRHWTREDYAAYIATHSIPLLSPYRRFGLWVRTSTGVATGGHSEAGQALLTGSQRAALNKRRK